MTDVAPVEEFLEHFGVKGMHWGKHGAGASGGSSSGGGSSKPKAVDGKAAIEKANIEKVFQPGQKGKVSSQDIKDARLRETARLNRVNQHADDLNLQTSDKGREKAGKIYEKSLNEYLNSADGPTAAKMTRGEKVTAAFGVGVMAVSIASVLSSAKR